MLSPPDARLFSPGASMAVTTTKCNGTSVTVGSFVAATTVRVVAGGGVWAAANGASATAPSSNIPDVKNRIVTLAVGSIV